MRAGHDRHRRLAQIGGAGRGGDDDRCRSVVLGAAVVEVEGLCDPAGGVVLLTSQRRPVAHGPGVVLRVGVARQDDLGERVLGHAVLVHVPHRLHRADLGRTQHAVGCGEGGRSVGAARLVV